MIEPLNWTPPRRRTVSARCGQVLGLLLLPAFWLKRQIIPRNRVECPEMNYPREGGAA